MADKPKNAAVPQTERGRREQMQKMAKQATRELKRHTHVGTPTRLRQARST